MRAIALLGLRGSGKSTVGRRLAEALGRPFVDLDDRALARLGAGSVTEAWARHGEAAFRAAELGELERVLAGEPEAVVALGGGTGMIDGFNSVVNGRARVVYLQASPSVLAARLQDGDENRPPLTSGGTATGSITGEMETVYGQRDPRYAQLASIVVDAEADVEEVVERVLAGLNQRA
jgi:shikimate kinase